MRHEPRCAFLMSDGMHACICEAASSAALDVERLARAMRACAGPKTRAAITWEGWIASAEPVAAEYARLTEQEERE